MAATSARPPDNELGTVKADGTLVTDRFPVPIPADDYLVLSGSAARLTPGQEHRVFVAWVNDGTDAVVVDTVQ
jgi:hypothetical protein